MDVSRSSAGVAELSKESEHHTQGGFSQILRILTHNCAGAGTYR